VTVKLALVEKKIKNKSLDEKEALAAYVSKLANKKYTAVDIDADTDHIRGDLAVLDYTMGILDIDGAIAEDQAAQNKIAVEQGKAPVANEVAGRANGGGLSPSADVENSTSLHTTAFTPAAAGAVQSVTRSAEAVAVGDKYSIKKDSSGHKYVDELRKNSTIREIDAEDLKKDLRSDKIESTQSQSREENDSAFIGEYTKRSYNSEQAELLSKLPVEALQNAMDANGALSFNMVGLGGDKATQQKWIDAGLTYTEEGNVYVDENALLDERDRRRTLLKSQKNTDGGITNGTEQAEEKFSSNGGAESGTIESQNGTRTEDENRSRVQGDDRGTPQEIGEESRTSDRGLLGISDDSESPFNASDIVQVTRDSVLYEQQRKLINEYGIECYIIKGSAWEKAGRTSPAGTYKGKVYVSEGLSGDLVETTAPHESTHVMKQLKYQPYLDFIDKTPRWIDLTSKDAEDLFEWVAEHLGLDYTSMDSFEADRLYDEMNAAIYGFYKTELFEKDGYSEWIPNAFYDFDSYIAELDAIHEQYKKDVKDERRAKAEERARKWAEWEDNTKPTAQELNTAREYVKGFDGHENHRRMAIIRTIRSAEGKVDEKTLRGVANLMAMRSKNGQAIAPDLEFRFAEGISDLGLRTYVGDKTLILINSDSEYSSTMRGTIAHELVHYIENKAGYDALAKYVLSIAKKESIAEIEAEYIADYEARNQTYTQADLDKEVVAKLVGKALNSEKFLARYAQKDGKLIKKLGRFLKGIVSAQREDAELSKVATKMMAMFDKALGEESVEGGKVEYIQYSLMSKDTLEQSVDRIKEMSDDDAISNKEAGNFVSVMKNTPSVILENVKDAEDLEIVMRFDSFYLATRHEGVLEGHYHNYGDIMKRLPDIIADPQAIVRMNDGRINIYSQVQTKKGNNSIVSIELNTVKDINSKYDKYNLIVSVVPAKDNYARNNLLNRGVNVEYEKEDLTQVNNQLHEWLAIVNERSSNNSIPQKSDLSTQNDQKNSSTQNDAPKEQRDLKPKKAASKQSSKSLESEKAAKSFAYEFNLDKGDFDNIKADLEDIEDSFVRLEKTQYRNHYKEAVERMIDLIKEKGLLTLSSDYTYKEFSQYMYRKRIRVDRQYRESMGREKWNSIYNSLRGRIASQENSSAIDIDSFYAKLNENFPELFPNKVVDVAERLELIAKTLYDSRNGENKAYRFDELSDGLQAEIINSVIDKVDLFIQRVQSNRDVITALKEERQKLKQKLKKDTSMREKIAKDKAKNSLMKQAKTYTNKEIRERIDTLTTLTNDEILSLGKGTYHVKMTIERREELVKNISIALHDASAEGESGRGSVVVKQIATVYAQDIIDHERIVDEDGKSYHFKDIYDESSLSKLVQNTAEKLYESFADIGNQTHNAGYQAAVRAASQKIRKEFADKETGDAMLRAKRDVSYEATRLKEMSQRQKRGIEDDGISLVTKALGSIVDAKGNIILKRIDAAVNEASRFLESQGLRDEEGVLAAFVKENETELSYLVGEFQLMRQGKTDEMLSGREMRMLAKILGGMYRVIREYNQVYVDGHWVDMDKLAQESVSDMTSFFGDKQYKNAVTRFFGEKIGKRINELYFYNILSPENVIEALEGYKNGGILKSLYHSVRVARQRSEHLSVKLKKPFAEFLDAKGEVEVKPAAKRTSGNKIAPDMTDAERYNMLKNRKLSLSAKSDKNVLVDLQEKIGISDDDIEYSKYGDRKKLFKKLGDEFSVYHKYSNADIQLDFSFSKGNMGESVSKQGKNFLQMAKMLTCLDEVVENAIGIEVHNRNRDGYKADNTLENVYVLASAFVDGDNIVPVKLEIKKFSDKENTLYVAIALENINIDGIVKQEVAKNGVARQYSPPSDISIAQFFKKINTKDESFLKYVPDGFLNEEQKASKKRELDKDAEKYGRKSDGTNSAKTEQARKIDPTWKDEKGRKRTYRQKINEKIVNVNGNEITLGEGIYLYMLTKREQSHAGLRDAGFVTYDENNQRKKKFKIEDVEAARDFLYGQFDDADKSYIAMAEEFFNKTSTEIKSEGGEAYLEIILTFQYFCAIIPLAAILNGRARSCREVSA